MKKQFVSVVMILMLLFISFEPTVTFGASDDEGESTTNAAGNSIRPGVYFDPNGDLIYEVLNTTATTSTKYRTKQFVVRLDNICTPISPYDKTLDKSDPKYKELAADKLLSDCNPLEGAENKDYIILNKSEFETIFDKTHDQDPQVPSGKTWSKFRLNGDVIATRLYDTKMSNLDANTVLYFNSIFEITIQGNPQAKSYTTLDTIRSAKPWRDKTGFRQYYDAPVTYKAVGALKLKYMTTDRTLIKTVNNPTGIKVIENPEETPGLLPKNKGKWFLGTGPAKGVPTPKTITDVDGKVYKLVCSYQQPMLDQTTMDCNNAQSDNPNFKRGTEVETRYPEMVPGGLWETAVYTADVECHCSTKFSVPNSTTIGGEITGSTIGKKVDVKIDLKQADPIKDDWDTYLKSASSIVMRVTVERSDIEQTGSVNTGADAIWTAGSGTPKPSTKANGYSVTTTPSVAQLKSYLAGNPVFTYTDDLMNYPITPGGLVGFRYNGKVTLIITDKSGKTKTFYCDFGIPVEINFFKKPEYSKDLYGQYTSVPSYYSEIKEGSPNNETFDAMTGTPTTRSLYFASGGSEYIVDIVTKYIPDATATRTYTSQFNKVRSGLWIDGDSSTKDDAEPPCVARTETDSDGNTFTESATISSGPYTKKEATYDSEGNELTPKEEGTRYTCTRSGGHNFMVGGYSKTWTQTITFDYTKIEKVAVWKLVRSKVDGMTSLIGTNEVTASIKQGDPTIFYNIAKTDDSAGGRLRYSLETAQGDRVVWNEGDSDDSDTNSASGGTVNEEAKFKERAAMLTDVTAISDFLILQTSSGDQSVMYFEKTSTPVKVETTKIEVPKTSKAAQWDNNSLSAAKWSTNQINIGSYNGNYASPTTKYAGNGSHGTVATKLDAYPAAMSRPARPSAPMILDVEGLNPILTNKNGLYRTGNSTVFYQSILKYGDGATPYSVERQDAYGANGVVFNSYYSPTHGKVNDVILHDPVSAEFAMIMPLPAARDQRTIESKSIGGNTVNPVIEYEKTLNPNYRQNLISNGDAELVDYDGTVSGWSSWTSTPGDHVNFTSRAGDNWVMKGITSFEINTTGNVGGSGSNYVGVYYRDITVKPNTQYKFSGDISCHRCEGYFYIDEKGSNGTILKTQTLPSVVNTGVVTDRSLTFTTSSTTKTLRIHIVKGNSSGSVAGYDDNLFADSLVLNNMSDKEWIPLDDLYQTVQVANPDYNASGDPADKSFSYTGAVQSFTAPRAGTYKIEAWGASGGGSGSQSKTGGKGGYSSGEVTLAAGQILNVYVGESPGQRQTGGWNGGGNGGTDTSSSSRFGGGGGGASDVRSGGTALTNRILVAGGGGGAGEYGTSGLGAGGGAQAQSGAGQSTTAAARGCDTGTTYCWGGGGGSQTQGGIGAGDYTKGGDGTLGIGGAAASGNASGNGGGGGGYYGGAAGGNDQAHGSGYSANGGGGSGYIGTLANGSMIRGDASMPSPSGGTENGHSGNGVVSITLTAAASSEDEYRKEDQLVPQSTEPPDEAYSYNEIKHDPMAPITVPGGGTYTPGNFVNLDSGFTVYFPNSGNFFGDGAWGVGEPKVLEGKGFTSPMDTTEWTKEKSVKFQFPVIYNGQTYLPNEEISLPVSESSFDFYVPLASSEYAKAKVTFKALAINGDEYENESPLNKVRYDNFAAKHSAQKEFTVDVVGNIGNLVIEDTGDFRFSNFFKQAVSPTRWLVKGVVKVVDPTKQNKIVGDQYDIRGNAASSSTHFLNTYGLLSHMQQVPTAFPLSPEKNNIAALRKQPMRMGYNVLADIQTTGNYYDSLQILPYYYRLDLKTGTFTPVDVYMNVNGSYKAINKFGAAVPGWDSSTVYPYVYSLNWSDEAARRNYSIGEEEATAAAVGMVSLQSSADLSGVGKTAQPYGNSYKFGTAQVLSLTGRNRTYIGNDETYGYDKNPGMRLPIPMYNMQAQRWHFTYGLPSSAVVVKSGEPITQTNIDKYRTNTSVIVMAAEIKSFGEVWALNYKMPGGNNPIEIAGTSYSTSSISYPIISVFSINKSSADDLEVSGTH